MKTAFRDIILFIYIFDFGFTFIANSLITSTILPSIKNIFAYYISYVSLGGSYLTAIASGGIIGFINGSDFGNFAVGIGYLLYSIIYLITSLIYYVFAYLVSPFYVMPFWLSAIFIPITISVIAISFIMSFSILSSNIGGKN
jgi:hypothetical protein